MLANFFQVLRYLAITVEKTLTRSAAKKKHADLAITVTVIGEGLLYMFKSHIGLVFKYLIKSLDQAFAHRLRCKI